MQQVPIQQQQQQRSPVYGLPQDDLDEIESLDEEEHEEHVPHLEEPHSECWSHLDIV
jgi:hypothetical protein